MSRSIHTTKRALEEARRYDYSDEKRRDQLVRDLQEQVSIKRRIKRHEPAYQEQVKVFGNWILHHGGVSMPLDLLAGDPRTTMKNGLINITRAWFDVPSAVGQLAKSVYDGKTLVETRLGFACDLHYGEDYQRALKIIEGVLAEDPENLEALTLRADIYEHQERYSEARELAEYVVRCDETRENAWHVLASIYEDIEEWRGLIETTTRLLEIPELGPMPRAGKLISRAKARLELGDREGAMSDIEAVEAIEWRTPRGAPSFIRRKVEEIRKVEPPQPGH